MVGMEPATGMQHQHLPSPFASVQDFPQTIYEDATVNNATHWCCLDSNSTIKIPSLSQNTVAIHFPVQDVLGKGLTLYFQECRYETMKALNVNYEQLITFLHYCSMTEVFFIQFIRCHILYISP
jgi:hypothetical protein